MELDPRNLSKTFYRLRRISRRLWVRAALIAALAVVATLTAGPLAQLVPKRLSDRIDEGAAGSILNILASSMLAVTIFSLSVMVSARQSASSDVTPRSHQILLEDTTTQTVLATFLGAFVFALVGIIELSTGYYSGAEVTVILGYTLLVVMLVVVAILRWIDHLTSLGSVIETTRKVEDAAKEALETRIEWPCLGARPLPAADGIPAGAAPFRAWMTGYVRHVDLGALSELAEAGDGEVYVMASPGTFLAAGAPLAWHTRSVAMDKMRAAFTMGDTRVFGQDPRFGLIVLTEIAQRALSSGVNDPGTAIDIIGRLERLLLGYRDEGRAPDGSPLYPRLWMTPLTADELLRETFDPIARDAAATVEVQLRLVAALKTLTAGDDGVMAAAAAGAARRVLTRAEDALTLPDDIARLRRAHSDAAAAASEGAALPGASIS